MMEENKQHPNQGTGFNTQPEVLNIKRANSASQSVGQSHVFSPKHPIGSLKQARPLPNTAYTPIQDYSNSKCLFKCLCIKCYFKLLVQV